MGKSINHFSLEERKLIEKYFNEGKRAPHIARLIGRPVSSTYQEIRKGRMGDGSYSAEFSQNEYHTKKSYRRKNNDRQFSLPLEVKESLNQRFKGNFFQENSELVSRIELLEMQVQILTENIRSLQNE